MKQLYQTLQPALNTWLQFRNEHIIPPVLKFPAYSAIDKPGAANSSFVAKIIWVSGGNNYLIYSGMSPGPIKLYC